MNSKLIYLDRERCIGCHACEVHCKTKNNLPVGPRLCRILTKEPQAGENPLQMHFVFTSCFHCKKPWCVDVCPNGAMQKRPQDGIVFVDPALCDGCQACITACPWEVPQWHPDQGQVVKCDHCRDRVDQGLRPACVTKCTAHALQWLTPDEIKERKRQ